MTSPSAPSQNRLLVLLRLSTCLCFFGWAWTHIYWESPLGKWLWQDRTFELLKSLGYSWEQIVGSGASDGVIQRMQRLVGYTLLASGIAAWLVGRSSRESAVRWKLANGFSIAIVGLGCLLLALIVYAKYVASQNQLPMLVEHGGQMLMPIILILAVLTGVRHRLTISLAVTALILTFAGHGCYAIGFWPTPSTFYAMTTVILGTSYETTKMILRIAGGLDFAVCLGALVPRIRVPSVIYAVVWGFLTAAARPVAGMSMELNYWGADQFLHEAVLRTPHWMIPLYLVLVWREPRQSEAIAPDGIQTK